MYKRIINVAVIAHVDAGKSTLVDALLKQSGTFGEREEITELVMDSDQLEKERGITIYSKNCSIMYGDTKINIVDTPGHADFSGEVERIMKLVDTVILLVDSSEGPMPQTRFVLNKSLENGLNPILLINKIDKPDARPEEVVNMTLELFMALNANDKQLDFPVLYGSARDGIVKSTMEDPSTTLEPLFQVLLKHVPEYPHTEDENLVMQIQSLKYDKYLGRLGIGRLVKGKLTDKGRYAIAKNSGEIKQNVGFSKLFVNKGLDREEVTQVQPGDIATIAGIPDITIGDTITSMDKPEKMAPIEIEEPTISMNFLVNKSPLAGKEGKQVTSRAIMDRLYKELESNVALKVVPLQGQEDGFEVKGRGELHLSILIENMRREGFELAVSKPKVLFKTIDGVKMEPYEEAVVTCDDEFAGTIIQQLAERKGNVKHMESHNGQTRMVFEVPTRGLIGYRQQFITTTRGTGILEKTFLKYDVEAGEIKGRSNGVLVSMDNGEAVGFALFKLTDRGKFFITPQTQVYEGMIIGIHAKDTDLDVNPTKGKALTNMRASGHDEATRVPVPIILSLEEALEFIEKDELVEVTPKSIRLRKKVLDKRYRHLEQY